MRGRVCRARPEVCAAAGRRIGRFAAEPIEHETSLHASPLTSTDRLRAKASGSGFDVCAGPSRGSSGWGAYRRSTSDFSRSIDSASG